jgi:UDP-glucose 4-epimerase
MRILVTGARGLVGGRVVTALAAAGHTVIASDLRVDGDWSTGVSPVAADLLTADWPALLARHAVSHVVHLAAVVQTRAGFDAARVHAIEVGGTQRLYAASRETGVRQFCVASSGAAYGYAADLPPLIREDQPLRPHPDFPYAAHKTEIEHWLAAQAGGPRICILRLCTVLAPGRASPVTALFERPRVLVLRGHASPFCFVHVDDVAAAFAGVIAAEAQGAYNVAGDGALPLREIARRLRRPVREVPPGLLRLALRLAHGLRLSAYTPGQVDFLAYRPVLDAGKLRRELGLQLRYDSEAAFSAWAKGLSA